LASLNALSNFDGANCNELGRDEAMPIGLLKVLRVAKLPGKFMPTLPTGRVHDQVRYF